MVSPDGSDGRDHSAAPKRSPPPPDLFEFFFPDLTSSASAAVEMCAADEIFVRGRLIPSNPIAPPKMHQRRSGTRVPPNHPPHRLHRRSESLNGIGLRGGGAAAEYRRLRRVSSDSDPQPPQPRPWWYFFVLGSVRVPAAMEMKDIRVRQSRQSPRPLAALKAEANEEHGGPWRLFRSLSCKAVESAVAAAAPIGLVSHVRAA